MNEFRRENSHTDLEQPTTNICHDVITNDKRGGNEEPDKSLEDVVDYKMAGWESLAMMTSNDRTGGYQHTLKPQ